MKNGVIMQDDVYHNESLKMLCSNKWAIKNIKELIDHNQKTTCHRHTKCYLHIKKQK